MIIYWTEGEAASLLNNDYINIHDWNGGGVLNFNHKILFVLADSKILIKLANIYGNKRLDSKIKKETEIFNPNRAAVFSVRAKAQLYANV